MTPEQEFVIQCEQLADTAKSLGVPDIGNYTNLKEFITAVRLGHKLPKKKNGKHQYAGEDAQTQDGKKVEYKSTIEKNCKGTYNGVSVYDDFEELKKYLKNKILDIPEHYYVRFVGLRIVECWTMTGEQAYNILLPKFTNQFDRRQKRLAEKKQPLKDPRFGADICWTEIKDHGKKVI